MKQETQSRKNANRIGVTVILTIQTTVRKTAGKCWMTKIKRKKLGTFVFINNYSYKIKYSLEFLSPNNPGKYKTLETTLKNI